MLDGVIADRGAGRLFIGLLFIWMIASWHWFGMAPRPDHLRKPDDLLILTPWNVLSKSKWTPEGVQRHRRVIWFCLGTLISMLVLFLILDAKY